MKLDEGYGCHYISKGKEYLDFTSGGIFQAILGNDFPQIPIFKPDLASCYGHTTPWTERYKDMLKEFTGFESVALFCDGSMATAAFWRCMRVYTGKSGIWGGLVDPDEVGTEGPLSDAMHGYTLDGLIMSGRITWPELGIGPEMGAARFGLAPEQTSGMIMEPYHAPSGQFHKLKPTIERILANQKEHAHIPLCVDEIQGGFGRTGRLFAHQWYEGLEADFVTTGKGQGAGFPLSALLGPKEIMESKSVKKFGHLHSTHSGHPMMCAIGCAVIEEIQKHDLIDKSQRQGVMLKNLLTDCGVRFHAGRGLMAGLEFKNKTQATKVYNLCLKKGLMVVNTERKWLKLGPALIITDEQLEEGIRILTEAIGEVLNAKTRRGTGKKS